MATWVQTSQFSKVMDAIKEKLAKKLDASGIKNNLTTEDSGYVLDARAGKTLGDRATTLETKVGDLYFDTDSSGNWGFKSSKNGAVKSFTATGAASTIESSNLTASKALVSDANGKVAASSTTTTELGYLHGVTSSVQEQMNSLNSNLTNVSTAADNINLYVGDDGKLHWVNKAGADSTLNFNPLSLDRIEDIVFGIERDSVWCAMASIAPGNIGATDINNGMLDSINRTMSVAWGTITINVAGHYIYYLSGQGMYDKSLAVGDKLHPSNIILSTTLNGIAWFCAKIKDPSAT